MVKNPALIGPEATLKDAAAKMESVDCGVLPVGTKGKITGIITDRDIVIRAISKGKDPAKENVANHMTAKAFFCKETDTIKEAASLMKKNKISRLVVKDNSGDVSGILSFGCILREDASAEEVADIITRVKAKKAA
ncbi:MAG: CBS domain-containing protein [Micavibrio aeruginosavorus]|uniref:CBS domain-containing protein n=1 Tax=Micavibrio aeruginosavorus TaxID=349221 RepID=A0A7T5UIG8_9BACT|nr:MAG: CBS domain-containing protein [Micavibrio aeruginosavorus]